MAIKRPTINKPGISKPNTGIKKPSMAKSVVEEPVQQAVQEAAQEEVNEIEVPVEEIEIPDDMIKTPPEIIEEPKQEQEEEQEEIVINEPEPVVEEKKEEEPVAEVVEEPAPKKKSSSRKKSSNKKAKEEPVVEEKPASIENYKAKPLVDAMKEMIGITGCTTPEWEQTKATITEQVESMHIDPDSTPAEMRYLIADIDAALSQLKIYKMNADQQFNPLLKHINYVSLQAGSKGANSEERKANAIRGLIEYKSNPDDMEYTNLLDIQVFAENQLAFYDEMIKILVDKKNMLITFSGIVKTETQLGGY